MGAFYLFDDWWSTLTFLEDEQLPTYRTPKTFAFVIRSVLRWGEIRHNLGMTDEEPWHTQEMSDLLFFLCHLRRTNIALFKSLSASGKGNENKMRKCIWSLKLLTTHSRRLPLKWLQVRSHHEHRGRERHRRRRGGSRELQPRHSACPSVQGVVVRTSAGVRRLERGAHRKMVRAIGKM